MGGVHYDGLSGYKSYDLAWLGPIVYPLTFAVIAQVVVFYDMARCRGKKRLDWLVPRSARQETGAAAPPDARITLLVLIVMASEATFALLCLVQCAINFTARSFPGGGGACDFQAFYATYYTFSSIGTFALAMVFGARAIITNGSCPLFQVPTIALSGVAVHGGALLIAALPLLGAGEYLFATDYCQYNVEGAFAPLVFGWVVLGLLTTTGSALAVARTTRPVTRAAAAPPAPGPTPTSATAIGSARAEPAHASPAAQRRSARRLFAACALYYAASWLTTLVLVALYWANRRVFDSPQWRVYGAQAIILHSNQLVVPLLVGFWFRHLLNALLARPAKAGGGDVEGRGGGLH